MRYELGTGLSPEDQKQVDEVLEKLRVAASAAGMGVTLVGNHLTLRFGEGDALLDAHLLVLDVDDGKEPDRCEWCGSREGVERTPIMTIVGEPPKRRPLQPWDSAHGGSAFLCSDCRCPK
jgi:hypothetical protein